MFKVVRIAFLFCVLHHFGYGQLATASIQGFASDPTGAAITGAIVQVFDVSKKVVFATKTDPSGRYVFASLVPGGPYTVSIQAAGFVSLVRSGVTLAIDQTVDLPLVLRLGNTSQTVEVNADASQLETSNATIGQVVSNRSVTDLPLNQRNAYSLVFLVPGVTGNVTNQYNSLNISVNGGRPGSSAILVDGIPASPPLVNPISGFAVFPSVEAVQEFRVITDGYSAQFGRSGSGIINLITKAGTNDFHGSAYEFLRNSVLDSNSYFSNQNGAPLPSFKRSQFGGSLTGHVVVPRVYSGLNRSFFLFSYEGLRQGTHNELTTTVPTALERTGDFSQTFNDAGEQAIIYDPATTTALASGYVRQPFPSNKIPRDRIDPVAAKVVNYYPLPNRPGRVVDNYFASGVSLVNSDTFDARVDQYFGDRNRMFVRYSRRNLTQPPVLLFPAAEQVAEGGSSDAQVSNSAAIDYTRTANPRLITELRYGFSRTAINFVAISLGFNPSSQLGFPSYIAANADHLIFPGIAPANYYTLGDASQGANRHGGFEIDSLGASSTKVAGRHLINFGVEGWLLRVNDFESGSSTGNFSFSDAITQGPNPDAASSNAGNSIASLLLGVGSGSMLIDSKNAATESRYFGAYIQDDWTATPHLSLNLGLRYDLDIPRTERYNRMETFDTSVASPLAAEAGLPGLLGGVVFPGDHRSRRQFSPQWTNVSPRLGVAYQIGARTVVRAAYGVFYGPSLRSAGATIGNEGFSSSTTYTGSPNGLTPSVYLSNPFPNGLNPIVGSSLGLLTGIGSTFETPLTGDSKVGYTQNYHLDVQRQLGFNILFDAAYVGSHGVHLNKSGENDWNLNQLSPQALALGTQLHQSVPNPFYGIIKTGPESGSSISRNYLESRFPQYAGVEGSFQIGGFVLYNSVQLKLEKRWSHGLSALVSYTGEKQIDNYSGIINVGNITGGIQNIWNPDGERAVSSNDISRNLTASAVYVFPSSHRQGRGVAWSRNLSNFLRGWQVNGIITEKSGFPLSPSTQDTSDSGGNVLRPNLTGISPIVKGSVKSRLLAYLDAAAFVQPGPFTFGDAPRTLSNVRAPGTHDLDVSLFKNFHANDRVDLQFRGEAFNMLNQVMFGSPNTTLSSSQFGVITSQANTPREIQLAVKVLF